MQCLPVQLSCCPAVNLWLVDSTDTHLLLLLLLLQAST
jgi:hypothetical protein